MFYNKYLVIGGAQNITKKCGSLPNNHKHIATMRQVQKLKQKSQSSISAIIEIPSLLKAFLNGKSLVISSF